MKITLGSMAIIDERHVIIQPLNPLWFQPHVPKIDMLRLDLLHPVISGNKWYKLKYNIRYAVDKGYRQLLTFGGVYSNHLIAAASAAKEYGLQSIGIIRGMYAREDMTPTLKECRALGMQLVFVSREDYNKKTDEAYLQKLSDEFNDPYIIPEGGANELGRKGVRDMARHISWTYTHVCVSVGSGTTFAGLRNALLEDQVLLGFAPMKNGSYLKEELALLINFTDHWDILDSWHMGGFGKWSDKLLAFMNNFYRLNNIPLDLIYTGKMMYGIDELLAQGYFPEESKILCVHTGGLQGNASVQELLVY